MGELYDEFEAQLATWQRQYATAPKKELRTVLLIAVEREQLVTIAYRADFMSLRLDSMHLPPDVKDVFSHALAWAQKDEEMHTVYSRGLLLKLGSPFTRFMAFNQQIAGAVGGWAASIKQHVPFSTAPIARTAAGLITGLGTLTGKVPKAIQDELRYLSFRAFCMIQVDAERTAAAAWRRLTELGDTYNGIDEATRREFKRMWDDEEKHREVFELIGTCLDDNDRLREGVTGEEVTEKIREVGEVFLPRNARKGVLAGNPIGSGGKVLVVQGSEHDDKVDVFRRAIADAGLLDRLRNRAQATGTALAEMRILIKPTFMLGYDRRDPAVITDPELLRALVAYLRESGCERIAVGEGRNIYDEFYAGRSVAEVARYFDLESDDYEIVDLTDEQVDHTYPYGMAQDSVATSWRDADFRIVFSKLRSHPVDFTHLCLGAMQGVGTRLEEFLFAERQAHRSTAIIMPLTEFPAHFGIIEGYDHAGDGLVGILGCAKPPRPRRVYAGADALSVDIVATGHLGMANPLQSEILGEAALWFGDPTERIEVIGEDSPVPGWRSPYHSGLSRLLSMVSYPVYELFSGRGKAFVPHMDLSAFPLKEKESLFLRAQRWFVRGLIGLRRPGRGIGGKQRPPHGR